MTRITIDEDQFWETFQGIKLMLDNVQGMNIQQDPKDLYTKQHVLEDLEEIKQRFKDWAIGNELDGHLSDDSDDGDDGDDGAGGVAAKKVATKTMSDCENTAEDIDKAGAWNKN